MLEHNNSKKIKMFKNTYKRHLHSLLSSKILMDFYVIQVSFFQLPSVFFWLLDVHEFSNVMCCNLKHGLRGLPAQTPMVA